MPSPFLRGKGDRLRWMRVVPSSLFAAPPKIRTVSPHQALRASFPLGGKPCIEPCSSRLLRPIQDPSTDARDDKESIIFQRSFGARGLKTGLPKIAAERDFWERGAAGATGKAASKARRQPWRLGATSLLRMTGNEGGAFAFPSPFLFARRGEEVDQQP